MAPIERPEPKSRGRGSGSDQCVGDLHTVGASVSRQVRSCMATSRTVEDNLSTRLEKLRRERLLTLAEAGEDLGPGHRRAIRPHTARHQILEVGCERAIVSQDLDDDVAVEQNSAQRFGRRCVSFRRRLTYACVSPMSFRSRHSPTMPLKVRISSSAVLVP